MLARQRSLGIGVAPQRRRRDLPSTHILRAVHIHPKPPCTTVTSMSQSLLPIGVQVFERGWLSANNVLLRHEQEAWLVDTGYVSHADQTLALVQHALGAAQLTHIVNTHLHSDHCGGNGTLQAAYPACQTWVPARSWQAVTHWDEARLSYLATGQECQRFTAQHAMSPGDELTMAGLRWQVLAAPGHDDDAVLLFEPTARVLIAGDAIWGSGLSVVFPEIDERVGFAGVAATLDAIESLQARVIIPGHGPLITDASAALAQSRSRLAHFERNPAAHAMYAAKVLLKFHLLAVQHSSWPALMTWMAQVPHLQALHRQSGSHVPYAQWGEDLVSALEKSSAARRDAQGVHNV